jgi:hypothetical protein
MSLDGGNYTLGGDEWNSSGAFTFCNNGNVAFQIKSTAITAPEPPSGNYLPSIGDPYGPGAYPNLYYGCNGSGVDCTSGSGLPLQVSAMTGGGVVTSSYNTTVVNAGEWDDSYDIWFNPTKTTGGLGDLEMMIWLDSEGGATPAGTESNTPVTIGGITYNVYYGNNDGTISYKMASGQTRTSVTNLDIGAFAANAAANHYGKDGGMTSSWYLENVQAGFEDFNGNVAGLTVNNFSVTVK